MGKYIFLGLALSLFLVSCNGTPKCNSEEVKKEVIAQFKKDISNEIQEEYKSAFQGQEYYARILPILKNTDKYIDDLEIKITETTSTDIKDDIKKCMCEASFNTVEKNAITEIDIKEFLAGSDIINHQYQIENFVPTIKYSAQLTDDKKLKIVIDNKQDLEIIRNNIAVKILRDIYKEAKKVSNRGTTALPKEHYNTYSNNETFEQDSSNYYTNTTPQQSSSYYVGSYYYVNASEHNKVYFYNSPSENTRRNSYFTTYERVYVDKVQDGFGYINFTNSRGQVSKGWVKMQYLEE